MEDPKTFENILSIILGEDISIKGRPQSEHESRTSPLKRQVRLDVWAEDETDAVYNVEAQKENTKNLPHRSRFYQALIDSKLLDPGEVDFEYERLLFYYHCTFRSVWKRIISIYFSK